MRIRFILKLAIRNLLTRHIRTLITVGGITIGMAAILFLVSFGYGLENIVLREISASRTFEVIDVSNGGSSALKIKDRDILNWQQIQNVKKVVPTVSLPIKAKVGKTSIDGIIVGVSKDYLELAELAPAWGEIPTKKGPLIAVTKNTLSLLGREPSEKSLGTKLSIEALIPQILTSEQKEKIIKEIKDLEIRGIIDNEETVIVYTSLENLKDWGVVGATAAKIRVNPTSAIPAVRKIIEGQGFQTDYIGDTVRQINQVFIILRIVLGSFGLVALIVAVLGMFNTLTVSLMERVREVGLMKAIGIKRKDIHRLFLFEALLIAVVGGLLGTVGGWLLGVIGNAILNYLARGVTNAPAQFTFFLVPYWFFLFSALFAFLVGLITGLYPARRATQINPLDALRYE